MNEFINAIKLLIQRPLPGIDAQSKMAPIGRMSQMTAPENAKVSSVMVLLFIENNEWHTLLMQRTEDGNAHGGQISFPGGKKEESDFDIMATAIRECEEEIGIGQNKIQVLGPLSPLYIPPSNFHVTPILGFIANDFAISISEREVQEVIKVPLSFLFDDKIKGTKIITTSSGLKLDAPVYVLNNSKVVWGATAMMISELEHLMKEIL